MTHVPQTEAEIARRKALTPAERAAEDNNGYNTGNSSVFSSASERDRRAALTQEQRNAEDAS